MRIVSGIALLIGIIVATPVPALVDPQPKHVDSRIVEQPPATVEPEKVDPADRTPAGERARNFLPPPWWSMGVFTRRSHRTPRPRSGFGDPDDSRPRQRSRRERTRRPAAAGRQGDA